MSGNGHPPVIDLPAVEPRPFDRARETDDHREPSVAEDSRSPTPPRVHRDHCSMRWRQIVAIAFAAVRASAATFTVERGSRPATPQWVRSCRVAIDATAQFHQAQAMQLNQIMYETWSIIGGLHIKQSAVSTSLEAQVQ
jgi:hypothetical protein